MNLRKTITASVLCICPALASAQQMQILQGKEIPEEWGIGKSSLFQFSAITPVSSDGDSHVFAVVSDKAHGGGIFYLSVILEGGREVTGTGLYPLEGTISSDKVRDPEGIVSTGDKFWVSGEADQRILEYDAMGYPTGRELEVPQDMDLSAITPNLGFESLAYDGRTIWTTTENSTREDVPKDRNEGPLLKIQGFDPESAKTTRRYLYRMDPPKVKKVPSGGTYVHGVSEMTALSDGRLAVLEREVYANPKALSVKSYVRIYAIDPRSADTGAELQKSLIAKFRTGLSGLKLTLANYEGMCEITLPDGSRALLLVNDSQGRQGYRKGKIGVSLSDYVRIVRLD